MFQDASVQVFGDADIQAVVAAADDIDMPGIGLGFLLKFPHGGKRICWLPDADIPGIDVDKVGLRIKSDPATLESQGYPVQTSGIERGETDINGLAKHVQAMAGHTMAISLEHGVGLRRSVPGNHFKKVFGSPGGPAEVMEQVEQGRINGMNIAGSEILQEVIDPVQGLGEITAIAKVDEGELLEGMGVIKREGSLFHASQ
jgi:hypothetical protein